MESASGEIRTMHDNELGQEAAPNSELLLAKGGRWAVHWYGTWLDPVGTAVSVAVSGRTNYICIHDGSIGISFT